MEQMEQRPTRRPPMRADYRKGKASGSFGPADGILLEDDLSFLLAENGNFIVKE